MGGYVRWANKKSEKEIDSNEHHLEVDNQKIEY